MNSWILVLEAGVALALLLLIVFTSMPRRKPDQQRDKEKGNDESR